MAIHNGYPIKGDIGYPTPGSFGTWAGIEKKIPMVTLEIESGAHAWNRNREALFAAIEH
jgi:protein MpaA